jgi:radical SAM superfamily enzyme YgiQ (UPF0313 family)
MAHINYTDEELYMELVSQLVLKNFYVTIDSASIRRLNRMVGDFFDELETFLVNLIAEEKPSVLGLSVYKGTLAASVFTVRLVKKKWPSIKIVMGGTIFSQDLFPGTPNYERFLERTPEVDNIFVGESEKLLLKYLRGELPEDRKIYTLEDVDNQLLILDTLDVPDYMDFDLDGYPLLGAYTSRGCVYRCSFCAETVYWKKYNRKKVEKVADDFIELENQYGKNIFVLTDCLINPLVTSLSKELIRRDLKMYWDVYIKVDNHVCDPQYTHLWRRGGFYRARLGIESGSQHILDIIDKKITVEQIKAAVTSLASAGIKTTTYWISGHPGETEEDFQKTLDLLEELQDDLYEAECDPFRYFHTGQVDGEKWLKEKGNLLLYPEEMTDMLLTQTYVLNEQPSREIIYQRQCRFREHCKKLGIPNPYSVKEIRDADQRWKALHKNAVPPLMDFMDGKISRDEIKDVSRVVPARNTVVEDVDFSF